MSALQRLVKVKTACAALTMLVSFIHLACKLVYNVERNTRILSMMIVPVQRHLIHVHRSNLVHFLGLLNTSCLHRKVYVTSCYSCINILHQSSGYCVTRNNKVSASCFRDRHAFLHISAVHMHGAFCHLRFGSLV